MLAPIRQVPKGEIKGQVVDLSLFEPLFSVIGPWLAHYKANGKIPVREGNLSKIAVPRNVYQCADGKHLALSALMQSMWETIAISIGRADLIDDARLKSGIDRVNNRVALDEIIAGCICARTQDDNLEHFGAVGVTVGSVCDALDLQDHEFIRGRAVVEDYPDEEHDSIPLHTQFPRLNTTPGMIRSAAPALGDYTDEILTLLGRDEQQRQQLREAAVFESWHWLILFDWR